MNPERTQNSNYLVTLKRYEPFSFYDYSTGVDYNPSSFMALMSNYDNISQNNKLKRKASTKAILPFNMNDAYSKIGGSAINLGINAVASLIPSKDYSGSKRAGLAKGLDLGYDAAMATMAAIPGIGTIGAGIMATNKLLGKGLDAIGVGTDRMTNADAILDSPFLKLTGLGLVNAIGAKKTKKFNINQDTNTLVGSSYQGSLNQFDDASFKSGKKYGLLSNRKRKKANRLIMESNRLLGVMTNINNYALDSFKASNNPLLQNRLQTSRTGGFQSTFVGKKGMKILDLESLWAKLVLSGKSKMIVFEEGGKMNIIPVGSLHKELNHLDIDGMTKKGIPVISKEDGGEIILLAEIEREELILTLEITETLEDYREEYKESEDKDTAALEAGKLLVDLILHNTVDKGKLIKLTLE